MIIHPQEFYRRVTDYLASVTSNEKQEPEHVPQMSFAEMQQA